MKKIKQSAIYMTVMVMVLLGLITACKSDKKSESQKITESQTTTLSVEEAQTIAEEAYIYGYPLVTMEMTRKIMIEAAFMVWKLKFYSLFGKY